MFSFRGISIKRAVDRIIELGTPAIVLIVAIGRIGPLFQSRLLNKFSGPLVAFVGFVIAAIHKFGSEALFHKVLETLKKQGKTEEQILEEINSYPIPEWLKLAVRSYIENVDFETIVSDDLSNRNEELFSIIQQSIGEDFEQLELNINDKIENLESQLEQLESRLNDRIDISETNLKRFIGITVGVGAVGTIGVVALFVFVF